MNKLLIVESYTKTKTIKKYLNDPSFIVTYSSGHIYNLPKDKIGFDTDTWNLEYIKTNQKIINAIREYVSNSDIIYIATDPDLEGETIAYNIKDCISDLIKNKTCYRVSFNEITENAVKRAINNPKDIDMNIVNAQETRRIVDRMIGYKVSPILWSKFNKNYLSSGRVQNAALIICINQRNKLLNQEIIPHWNIDCKFIFDNDIKHLTGTLLSPINITDVLIVKKILGELKTKVKYTVHHEMQKRNVSPPPPYTTTSLQQDCYNKYKWSAKNTMKLAQDLYENGAITYIRTDSINICDDAKKMIVKYINKNYSESYAKYRKYTSRINNAQEAHEAIRITNPDVTTCNFQNITSNHNKLYDIIRKRTLASLMSDAEYCDIICKFKTDTNKYEFSCKKSFMNFEGFKIIYDEKREPYEHFIQLLENSSCKSYEFKSQGTIDNIPSMYNEVQLIKHLEKEGIGRPSTYASIIDKLIDKKYVAVGENPQQEYKIENFIKKYKDDLIKTEIKSIQLGGKNKDLLIPTDLGNDVIKYTFEVLPYLCDLKFTSNMEKDLDDIINLKNNKKSILDDIYGKISKSLKSIGVCDKVTNKANVPKISREDYKDGVIKTRYGICYYNKSKNTYTNIEPYLKWKGKDITNLNDVDIAFISSLPKDVTYLNKPYKLHIGRYGLYLKDDKQMNHKIEKKLWDTFF
jgi:DNA topoisomerase I